MARPVVTLETEQIKGPILDVYDDDEDLSYRKILFKII
jgi:hypothetical protein